jgi:precorrin-6A/cobalt-precorrin-6A reductase
VTSRRVLVLGGTHEARLVAGALDASGVPVTSSLATRVTGARLPAGDVRMGGFGGHEGLAAWIRAHDVAAVLDATHPFAGRIARSAALACAATGTPLLRLERPGWTQQPDDRWHWVDDLPKAAAAIAALGRRVLLTTGRKDLSAFASIASAWFLVRCIEAPDQPLPPHHRLLLDRGPYTVEGELALIDEHRLDLVVTKDSGGDHTAAKLEAARRRSLPVLIVRRPPRPVATTVFTVDEAVAWARESGHSKAATGALGTSTAQPPQGAGCPRPR